jgi:ribosomal protein S12 methylthiotransferase
MDMIRGPQRRIHVRTSLIVGFPGETDEMFEDSVILWKWPGLTTWGSFPSAPRRGRLLPASGSGGRKDGFEKKGRLMELQADISKGLNQQKVGQVLPVLVEGESSETELLLAGRTSTMAPDVDGRVLINEGRGSWETSCRC